MSRARKIRTKRVRRKVRRRLKFGRKATPTHQGKSGRTGGMHAKKLKSRM